MASRGHNRGPHSADAEIFAARHVPELQQATEHLSWLLSRGYAAPSSLKLVGDRFALVLRQRTAVMRSACSDHALQSRLARSASPGDLAGGGLEIDTLNLLITIEAALSQGVVLRGRDGTYRDMASIHGTYRKVEQTPHAIELVRQFLQQHGTDQVIWRIDRPVSNSGRLRELLLQHAVDHKLDWQVRLDDDPDRVLGDHHPQVVSADAAVLDRVCLWVNLARWIVDASVPDAWVIPMTADPVS